MKNNFYNIFITTFVIFFYANLLYGSELNVLSSEIKIEKNSKVIVLKGNVTATDDKNNKLYTDSGTYEKKKNIFKSFGSTKILTSEKYEVVGNDMLFDNKKKIISSNNKTKIIDKDGNQIFLDMFSYATEKNMFFSKEIKIIHRRIKRNHEDIQVSSRDMRERSKRKEFSKQGSRHWIGTPKQTRQWYIGISVDVGHSFGKCVVLLGKFVCHSGSFVRKTNERHDGCENRQSNNPGAAL